ARWRPSACTEPASPACRPNPARLLPSSRNGKLECRDSRLLSACHRRTHPAPSRRWPDHVHNRSTHYMTITTTDKAPKQVAVNDIGSAEDFLAAVEQTLKFFNDGDLIEGTVVKVDRDEVLLDVG